MPPRPCLVCGVPTRGSRCPAHALPAWGSNRGKDPAYSGDWPAIRAGLVRDWVAEHGWWCPGVEGRPPHPSRDLTGDHIIPVAEGGTHDRTNLRVLCRGCNTSRAVRAMNERRRADPTHPTRTSTGRARVYK